MVSVDATKVVSDLITWRGKGGVLRTHKDQIPNHYYLTFLGNIFLCTNANNNTTCIFVSIDKCAKEI